MDKMDTPSSKSVQQEGRSSIGMTPDHIIRLARELDCVDENSTEVLQRSLSPEGNPVTFTGDTVMRKNGKLQSTMDSLGPESPSDQLIGLPHGRQANIIMPVDRARNWRMPDASKLNANMESHSNLMNLTNLDDLSPLPETSLLRHDGAGRRSSDEARLLNSLQKVMPRSICIQIQSFVVACLVTRTSQGDMASLPVLARIGGFKLLISCATNMCLLVSHRCDCHQIVNWSCVRCGGCCFSVANCLSLRIIF